MATLRSQIRDASWVRQSFLVNSQYLDEFALRNRDFSIARFKFADTTLGGSLAINPPPQFTRNADPKVHGLFSGKTANGNQAPSSKSKGMGRYYVEAIEDNSRIVSMRFGVPKHNSLTTFFTGFYNADLGQLAKTGRGSPSVFYTIGKTIGYIIPLLYVPLLITNLAGNIGRYLFLKPSSKYYYLKPTMPNYWSTVQAMVNLIAVNKGIIPRFLDPEASDRLNNRMPYTPADMERYWQLLPDIVNEAGGINVYAMATRHQRLARRMYLTMEKMFDQAKNNPSFNITEELIRLNDNGMRLDWSKESDPSFLSHLDKWFKTSVGQSKNKVDEKGNSVPSTDTEGLPVGTKDEDVDGLGAFFEAELDDGSSFIAFRVNAEGSVNESFSNSTGQSEIASKINGISASARQTVFNFGGGNINDGLIGSAIQMAMGAVGDVVKGVTAGVGMSGLAALGGSAFADIPEVWQSSTASLPSMSYSFDLVSPYGNKMSQLQNLYVPLAMILAGALPLSTGPQSYTQPFLVELYDRGRAQTRLGIIDSLNITRGITNLPFSNRGETMSIRVTFSVKDLSSVMHIPITQGFSIMNPTAGVFDDDNAFTDYMAVLGSLTLVDQIYPTEKLRLAITRQLAEMNTWFSAAHWANFAGDTAPARLASLFYTGLVNR